MSGDDSLLLTCLASGSAGLIGRTICHPIDTVKAKLQAAESSSGLIKVVTDTWKKEGIFGFYRGLGAVLVGGVPGVSVYLSTYEISKKALQGTAFGQQNPFYTYISSGLVAEATCCLLFIPVDVVKERLQVQSSRSSSYNYTGSLDALRTIFRQEGWRGLYKGYWATVLSYGPFSSLYFWLFEEMKNAFVRYKPRERDELTFRENLLSASVAGSAASLVTNPLDIAKLRFQIQQSLPTNGIGVAEVRYRGLLHAMQEIYAMHGVRGLFRGAFTRMLFHTPSTAFTMASYEEMKRFWKNRLS